jgi:hypothetical protein
MIKVEWLVTGVLLNPSSVVLVIAHAQICRRILQIPSFNGKQGPTTLTNKEQDIFTPYTPET